MFLLSSYGWEITPTQIRFPIRYVEIEFTNTDIADNRSPCDGNPRSDDETITIFLSALLT